MMPIRHPTTKQLQAIQLINQGMSARKAMLTAGYSKVTASNPKDNLYMSKAFIDIQEQMRIQLENMGITPQLLAEKLGNLLMADNSKDFFMAYDRIKQLFVTQPTPEVKKKWEYTEWVKQGEANQLKEDSETALNDLSVLDSVEVDHNSEPIVDSLQDSSKLQTPQESQTQENNNINDLEYDKIE